MGVAYYPSDPERWLFLTPAVWLALGLVWDAYDPPPGARLDHRRAAALLVASVVALGLFNAAFGLLPEARGNRTINGMKALAGQARPGDLVVSLSGLTHPVYGFYLGKPLACDNLVFMDLVKRYGADTAALKEAIRAEIRDRLARGGRVLVFGVQGERHVRGEGYPWSHVAHLGIGPETLAEALEPFDPTPLPGTGSDAVSIAALGPRHVPIATRMRHASRSISLVGDGLMERGGSREGWPADERGPPGGVAVRRRPGVATARPGRPPAGREPLGRAVVLRGGQGTRPAFGRRRARRRGRRAASQRAELLRRRR